MVKWTASEKTRIVIESLTTNISLAELFRKHNLSPNTFHTWKEKFTKAGKSAMEEIDELKNIQHTEQGEEIITDDGEKTVTNEEQIFR